LQTHQRLQIDGNRHLTVGIHEVNRAYPLHWHSFFEIELVLSGNGSCVVNDVEYDVEEYQLFFLSTTDFHRVDADRGLRVINVSFDEEAIDEEDLGVLLLSQTPRAYRLSLEEYDRMVSAAMLLRHECEIDGDCQRQLLQYLVKCMRRQSPDAVSALEKSEHYRGIKRAIVYMKMHFKEPISLQRLAAEAGYHPTYFSELFQRITGESYLQALIKLRVGYARTLLANGFSVSDTCFLSGFGSLSNFGAVFKKHCRVSPGEYRRKHKRGIGHASDAVDHFTD